MQCPEALNPRVGITELGAALWNSQPRSVSSPNPELSRSSPGSHPGMQCQAQLKDQSLFSPLLLSFFFLPSKHGKSLLSSNVTITAFALIKPQISSSKCLTRTDATGSCSLLRVPFPINLMAESASAAGTSLSNKGALGAAAWSILSVLGGLGGGGDPPESSGEDAGSLH